MRRLLTVPALVALVTTAASGQRPWDTELGIQGGVARIKPAGTRHSDHTDLWDLPGVSPGYGTLFIVVPVTPRLAIEPGFFLLQTSLGEPSAFFTSATAATLGLRGDVALFSVLYTAAGAVVSYSESGGTNDFQLGAQAALGTRVRLGRRVRGRLEAHVITFRKTANVSPVIVYGLLLGLSAPLK